MQQLYGRCRQLNQLLPLVGGGRTRFQPIYVGDVATANRLLGYHWFFSGKVVLGDQRGGVVERFVQPERPEVPLAQEPAPGEPATPAPVTPTFTG